MPPEITAAGVTIPRANHPAFGIEPPVNLNTASEWELAVVFSYRLNDDLAAEVAERVVAYRRLDVPWGPTRYPGFETIQELQSLPIVDENVYRQLADLIASEWPCWTRPGVSVHYVTPAVLTGR